VGHLIANGELLNGRVRGQVIEGTSGQETPGRGAGRLHHYQYAPCQPGGCSDALGRTSRSRNQGAESTLAMISVLQQGRRLDASVIHSHGAVL